MGKAKEATKPHWTVEKLISHASGLGIMRPLADMRALAQEALAQDDPAAWLARVVEDEPTATDESTPEVNETTPQVNNEPAKVNAQLSLVDIPLAPIDESKYAQGHIEIRFNRADNGLAYTLKSLHEGLYQAAATLPDGRHIKSPADALKWLLYKVQLAAGGE